MTLTRSEVSAGLAARASVHAARPPDAVARDLGVDPDQGLTSATAARRLNAVGANRLAEPASTPRWRVLLDQFRNLLVLILLGAAVLAFVVNGDLKDPLVIGFVVVLNAVLGYVQERRAEASLAALRRMLVPTARVRRDGVLLEIAASDVVPGDVAVVEAGDRVPADGRWIEAIELEVDEASLTGESTPTAKTTAAVTDAASLAELSSMGFMNTTLTRGRGALLVTATGMDTEIGQVADLLASTEQVASPLQRQIHQLARRLTIVAGAAVAAVLVIGLARGQSLGDEIVNAVALAVAAIPEGLPAVLTITLAVGTQQLAKRNAIVKRLASVETLGCTSVICSDKTGTLTLNRMTARALWSAGHEHEPDAGTSDALDSLVLSAVLCNDSHLSAGDVIGDPTEGALLGLGERRGVDQQALESTWTRIAEIPFDSTRKLMVTAHRRGDRVRISAKGAPDVLVAHCPRWMTDAGCVPMDAAGRTQLVAAQESLATRGLRVLATASSETDATAFAEKGLEARVDYLVLEGLIGIMDPPRPEAKDAIATCHHAGIAVKMITGDHAATAAAIGHELGIRGEVVTGAQLDEMDDAQLASRIDDIGVFARVAPTHKVRIVRALREQGRVVAMTGDGVNDAPALKSADIGVAMGITGTEVSKEAATMVLTDDNFATIVAAVRGGRAIYDNIVKFVRFQLSTNMGAILTILTAAVLALPVGGGAFFGPLALLWVNLIMDGPPAMALGVDPPSPGAMDRPPRDPRASILGAHRFAVVLLSGAVMAAGTISVYLYAAGGLDALTDVEQARATTMAFTTFVFFQMFNLFNARFERASAIGRHSLQNWKLWAAIGVVVLLQVLAVTWGTLQQLFTRLDVTATLSPTDWLVAIAMASSVLWVEEVRKGITRRQPAVDHTRVI